VEFELLQKEIHELARTNQASLAETRLLEAKQFFQGKAQGRWYTLYAQVIRRTQPENREIFTDACVQASRLLQMDHAALCELYLVQMAAAMSWGDWTTARVYVRRTRAFFRRYPSNYDIQRFQCMVLFNEGIIEVTTGNFPRAISLSLQGLEAMDRYYHPSDEQGRQRALTVSLHVIADSYLRLGQHGKAIEYLSRIDPAVMPKYEYSKHCYLQSRYWLALGVLTRAEEWFGRIDDPKRWEPDWPAWLLELEAGIAKAKGDRNGARQLFQQAIELTGQTGSQSLMLLLRHQLKSLEEA
jgi:tetratricopeptide (TPR) repeat protein